MKSEDEIQQLIRLEAPKLGVSLFRNNSGVLKDATGRPVRYGLGNDSPKINANLKSSDLIGITKDGIFVAVEVKKEGWKYTGDDREKAQKNFIDFIKAKNGIAGFCQSVEEFQNLIKDKEYSEF